MNSAALLLLHRSEVVKSSGCASHTKLKWVKDSSAILGETVQYKLRPGFFSPDAQAKLAHRSRGQKNVRVAYSKTLAKKTPAKVLLRERLRCHSMAVGITC